MPNNPEVLAIDDDVVFVTSLKTYFADNAVGVATISDAVLSTAVDFQKFKVVLLDLDMPGMSGVDVLKNIVAEPHRPSVIIVSSHSDLESRISLLEKGADFFLPKPVDLNELLFVCKRCLGRSQQDFEIGQQWRLSSLDHRLNAPDGSAYRLTSSEYLILENLFEACPEYVTKDKLVKAISAKEGEAAYSSYRSLEVMISRMRSRFSSADCPLPIKALRNVGYVFHGNCAITLG